MTEVLSFLLETTLISKGCPHFLEAACSFLPHGFSQRACLFCQAAESPLSESTSNQESCRKTEILEGSPHHIPTGMLCPPITTRCDSTGEGQQTLPTHRERATDFGLESRNDQSPSVAEEQIVLCGLENSCPEEGTDKGPRSEEGAAEGAAVLQGSSVDMQPASPLCGARRADRAPHSVVPAWVREAPVAPLQVRFTPHAEKELGQLSSGSVDQPSFRYFQSAEEARRAIEAVLAADPRSVYRRKLCQDRLFYFTVDIAHVTCWFGDGFAEVLKIKPFLSPCS
uniref:Uncharacterized protein n=1 Tax=Spermophilus dauricus TaxID=99837 RepID=A0A8C9QBK2_SPEDA